MDSNRATKCDNSHVAGGKGFLLGAQVPQLLRQLSHTLLAVLQLALLPRPVPLLGGAVLLLEPAQLLRRPRPPAPRLLALWPMNGRGQWIEVVKAKALKICDPE